MGKKRQRNEEMQSKDGDGSRGKPKLSKLQQKMSRSLSGAQFRSLNQELYTQPSATSFAKFVAEPKLFDIYHCGFREQVAKWPINPLNVIVKWIKVCLAAFVILSMSASAFIELCPLTSYPL
eukprot:313753_1